MEPFVASQASHQLLLQKWMMQCEHLTSGFTTRMGGYSEKPYASFNIGLHVNDEVEAVVRNRQLLTDSIGWEFDAWTNAQQVHGNIVVKVTTEDRGRGRLTMSDALQGADGMITNVPDILLTSFYADCVPLLFWDPVHEAIGLAHAGWKGTASAIAIEMVEAMKLNFGTEPDQLMVAIGPSIDQCCYEVDHYVVEQFVALWQRLELQECSIDHVIKPISSQKAHINLKEMNRQIMIKAGILPTHIELSNLCTGCRTDMFFSHRVENGLTGRMASWIGLSRKVIYE
ncbi:peptidoglycan editing factor PgeF [Paenibacillus endoradicis]|uniref:peptidoglycan editing factor PgeF n=1 Tax=Paenibacillus endoradicis TaxID=2972487 RepID=UPI002158DC32|nr:peptidoglycan editing factor PgeF [Paenibacillus endoradicis]MCR8656013.1 peptidoglycan editing factor PgeF [Paenibacillus endoradicis]MCR8658339.1 peptidoglycan editing factor PgeF [Paenibacillus endoradicis]